MAAMRWTRSPALVAVFVVLDVVVLVLAYRAMRHNEAPLAASSSADGPIARQGPTIVGPLSLAVAPSGALLRATRGSCDERAPVPAKVWVAGAYRAPLERVTVPGLVEVLGATASDDKLTVVGADGSCKTHGYVSTDSELFAAGTHALASGNLDVDLDGAGGLIDASGLGNIRLEVDSRTDKPVFVGIARTDDVSSYLRGVSHTAVTDVTGRWASRRVPPRAN